MSVIAAIKNIGTLIVNEGRQRAVDGQRLRAWQLQQQLTALQSEWPALSVLIQAADAANDAKKTATLLRDLSANFRKCSLISKAWARCIDVAVKVGG